MKLVAVCGFGVGSSIIAKMNIESILQKRNREDIVVETIDLGSVQGADGDYYVTTNELFDNFPDGIKERTIVLNNFIDLVAIESALEERIGLQTIQRFCFLKALVMNRLPFLMSKKWEAVHFKMVVFCFQNTTSIASSLVTFQ